MCFSDGPPPSSRIGLSCQRRGSTTLVLSPFPQRACSFPHWALRAFFPFPSTVLPKLSFAPLQRPSCPAPVKMKRWALVPCRMVPSFSRSLWIFEPSSCCQVFSFFSPPAICESWFLDDPPKKVDLFFRSIRSFSEGFFFRSSPPTMDVSI